jgi:hypothetical protein
MNFVTPTERQIQDALGTEGYKLLYITDNGRWKIAIKPVIFGWRAVAYEADSFGCVADYCAGDRPIFAIEIAAALKAIFTCLPDGVTEAEVKRLLPEWGERPIDRDSCWDQLQELSREMQDRPIAAERGH